MVRLDDILEKILAYNPDADLDVVRKAYVFSAKVHQSQTRLSGQPYLTHPMEVADLLCQLRMDSATVATGLLHDVLEDTLTTREELEKIFNREVAELVDGVTKISKIPFRTSEERQAENYRKMIVAMARDIRVVLVKLADRVHNMRTLEYHPPERQQAIARETLDIYAPLANRLGISWIKGELEDLSFRFLKPEIFYNLANQIAKKKKEREAFIDQVGERIRALLKENGIEGEVSGRSKHLYSVYRKMERQGIDLNQVYDLTAFRVLVPSLRDCYAVLGCIHAAWKPIPGRFKDYIAMPKANGYQSLHTTVIGPHGERMEVQIRTIEMHRVAEEGIAAHWKYKEAGPGATAAGDEDKRFGWLRQLLEWQQELKDSREYLDSLKAGLFSEEVYVFTPGGEVKELPRGASPIDFAYSVHSDVGHRCVGARVNGKLVPLKSELKNGDIVEILTSANQSPSKDWLKLVKTSRARNRIRQWIKTEEREKSITLGKDLLEKELRKYGKSLNKLLGSRELVAVASDFGFHKEEDLLAAIGYGKLSHNQAVSRLVPREKLKSEPAKPGRISRVMSRIRKKPSSAIKVHGLDDIMVRFAKCCNPLPGDPVIGFITRGRGVTVHASDCPRSLDGDPQRRIEVEWDRKKKASRPVKIRVFCENQRGMLTELSGAITNCEANIISANVYSTMEQRGVNTFEVDVEDVNHLKKVITALQKIKGVYRVERLRL